MHTPIQIMIWVYWNSLDYMRPCQHITSASGVFGSLEPVVTSQESPDGGIRSDLRRKNTLLISVKPNQVIYMDFENQGVNKSTQIKVFDLIKSRSFFCTVRVLIFFLALWWTLLNESGSSIPRWRKEAVVGALHWTQYIRRILFLSKPNTRR